MSTCALLHLLLIISSANTARILGISPVPMYSHQLVFRTLWRELSLKGHQVTALTTHPLRDSALTNLTEIDMSRFQNNLRILDIINSSRGDMINLLREFNKEMIHIIDEQLSSAPVKSLISDPNVKFDLVIAEYYFTAMFAFAERFGCSSIGILSVDGTVGMYRMMGNPTHPVLYPDGTISTANQLGLADRVMTVFGYCVSTYLGDKLQTDQQELVAKHFGSHYPSVAQLAKNVSLLFVNADPIFHQIRPLVPAIIQIGGGFHRVPAKPLPKDLRASLDLAHSGFIYFSLGSNVRNAFLSSQTVKVILDTFAELPFLVLWKFDDEDLSDKPSNVILSKWVPQQDVLRKFRN